MKGVKMDIVTQKLKLKDINPELAKDIAAKYGMQEDDVEFIRKGLSVDSRSYFSEGEKASIDYINTKTADRDKQIVVPSGIDLSDYRKTPVVLWAHNYYEMPIGKNQWIKTDEKGLIAKTIYHTRAGTKGQEVHDYLADGFPLASSIGFIPLQYVGPEDYKTLDLQALGLDKKDIKNATNGIYTKSLLLEYSRVPVPSNADAVSIAVSKGLITMEEVKSIGFNYEDNENVQDQAEEKECNEEEEIRSTTVGDGEQKAGEEVKATDCTCGECGATFTTEEDSCPTNCPDCTSGKSEDTEEEGCGNKPNKPKKEVEEDEINILTELRAKLCLMEERIAGLINTVELMANPPVIVEEEPEVKMMSFEIEKKESVDPYFELISNTLKDILQEKASKFDLDGMIGENIKRIKGQMF
jgi:hypothetical protein